MNLNGLLKRYAGWNGKYGLSWSLGVPRGDGGDGEGGGGEGEGDGGDGGRGEEIVDYITQSSALDLLMAGRKFGLI